MGNVKENTNGGRPRPSKDGSSPTLTSSILFNELGSYVGPYKLISVLGEGGFGIVFLAEQKRPVRRYVALKVIKPGMDSKQVLARFEAERQALVLLNHPSIARVLDAGSTDAGRPFFVLELVKGLSITDYCDHHCLSIEERLKLFARVCEAVQHAHQKGIIHRDIKPSNILVSEQGGEPVPKIIDFGVAKAISQPLTEHTLVTEQGQFVGTPEYMSPEQAGVTIEDIDTRSDIYSLGVLLYELLTGVLPFSHEELMRAGHAEIQRIIREMDPPRPSTRLSSLGEEIQKIAQCRRTEIQTLTKRIHSDLEWIPLKAIRKEPDRRYRTASELADDVHNFLNGNPLIAGPESLTYRIRKYAQKFAVPVIFVTVILTIIISALVISTVMYINAERARAEADKLRQEAEIQRDKALEAEQEAEQQAKIANAMATVLKSASELDLSGASGSHLDLGQLTKSHELRNLDLRNTQVEDTDLVHIKDLIELEGLFLGNTKITDAGLTHAKNLTSLRILCVHRTQVGDAGLTYLKNLKSLRYLCLQETNISDVGLAFLKSLESLRSLSLDNTNISDNGLVHIKGLTMLKRLGLWRTHVTESGLKDLQAALPNCKIVAQIKVVGSAKLLDTFRSGFKAIDLSSVFNRPHYSMKVGGGDNASFKTWFEDQQIEAESIPFIVKNDGNDVLVSPNNTVNIFEINSINRAAYALHFLVWGYSYPKRAARLSVQFTDYTSQDFEIPLNEWTQATGPVVFDFSNTVQILPHAAITYHSVLIEHRNKPISAIISHTGTYGLVAITLEEDKGNL